MKLATKKIGLLVIAGLFLLVGCGEKQVSEPVDQPTDWPTEKMETVGESMETSAETPEWEKECGPCPQYAPPIDNWCQDGTIIPPQKDECGCYGHPVCQKE